MKFRMIILFMLLVTFANAQDSLMQQKLSPNQVKNDLKILVAALEEAHPGLYRYNTPTSFKSYTSDLVSSIEDSMTMQECYGVYSKLIAGIRDGHTRLQLPEEIELYQKFLPILVTPENNAFYLKKDLSNTINDTTRCQILAINGRPVHQLFDQMKHYIWQDGYIATGHKWQMEELGFSKWYYALIDQPESYAILYSNGIDTLIKDIPAMPHDSVALAYKSYLKKHKTKPLQKVYMRSEISGADPKFPAAVLRVNSFHPPEILRHRQNYHRFTSRFFRKLRRKKCNTLIIDLRDNSGGESMFAIQLFRYISKEPFTAYDRVELNKLDSFSFKPYTKMPSTFQNRRENHAFDAESGFWHVISHPALEGQEPMKNAFDGEVIILTSGKTFSAASVFCSLAQNRNRATFVGEETGGAYNVFSAGAMPVLTLPNTEIRVQIPLVNMVMDVKDRQQDGRGVQPSLGLDEVNDPYVSAYLRALRNL